MEGTAATAANANETVSQPTRVKRERSDDEEEEERRVSQRTSGDANNATTNDDTDVEATIVECVKTISHSNDEEVLYENMKKIADALYEENRRLEKQQIFLRVGGPLAVVTKMAEHPDCIVLQKSGIRVLTNATHKNKQLKSVVAEVDGIQAIMNAMKRFDSTKEIQVLGLTALITLSYEHTPNAELMVQKLEVLSTITAAMKKFSDDAQVVLKGCCVLWNLAKVEALREPMVKVKVPTTLARAIERYEEDEVIQKYAREAMKSLL